MSDTAKTSSGAFPIGPGRLFREAFAGYIRGVVPISVAGLVTLVTFYLAVALPAQSLENDGTLIGRAVEVIILILGLSVVGTMAYPWYSYVLDAVDGVGIRLRRPFEQPGLFMAQAVSSFWFWAGVGLGFRYLAGIPSIFVVLLYCFHGYFIADRRTDSGLKALGLSVRMTQGRRMSLFALGALLLLFTMMGALALGWPDANGDPIVSPLTISLAVLGLTITSSVTLVAGAVLYRHLQAEGDVSVTSSSKSTRKAT